MRLSGGSWILLTRFGIVSLLIPEGDKIRIRTIHTYKRFFGFFLGGIITNPEIKEVSLNLIKSKRITLRDTSVTWAVNIILSSVLEKEKPHEVGIYNTDSEPYIQQLVRMLNQMSVNISGAGTNLIKIKSVPKLFGTSHKILPDMLEIGSFISLAVATWDMVSWLKGWEKNIWAKLLEKLLRSYG